MLKKYKLELGILFAGIIVIALLLVASPTPQPAPIPEEPAHVKIAVTEAKLQTARLTVKAHGTVTPKREIDLVAQVSGQIVSVEPAFNDGGFFTRSQVLVQIDDRDYQVALLSAKARLANAVQQLAEEEGRSRLAARQWRDLGDKKGNDLFVRKPQLAAAHANLASAKGDVAMAELNLERTKISAPFDGRVKETYAGLGQYLTIGSRIATVYDSTIVEVRLPLTEKQASLVDLPLTAVHADEETSEAGAKQVELPAVTIRGSVAGKSYEWLGVLARTDAFVDANSRMYYAVIEVLNPFAAQDSKSMQQAPLLPGLFVEAEIDGKELHNVLVLPRAALIQRDKIITLDDDGVVKYQTVNVLRKSATEVWVQGEIAENTLVSIEKQSLTPPGSIVEPVLNAGSGTSVAVKADTVAVKD